MSEFDAQSRPANDRYRENYEKIFGKKSSIQLPQEHKDSKSAENRQICEAAIGLADAER